MKFTQKQLRAVRKKKAITQDDIYREFMNGDKWTPTQIKKLSGFPGPPEPIAIGSIGGREGLDYSNVQSMNYRHHGEL